MAGELMQVFLRQENPPHDPSKVSVRRTLPRTPGRGFNWRLAVGRYMPERAKWLRPVAGWNPEVEMLGFFSALTRYYHTMPRRDYATHAARQIARWGRSLRLLGCPLRFTCEKNIDTPTHTGSCGVLQIIPLRGYLQVMAVPAEHLDAAERIARKMLETNTLNLSLTEAVQEKPKPMVLNLEDLGL